MAQVPPGQSQGTVTRDIWMELCSYHLPGDLFSGQLGWGARRAMAGRWHSARLGAEQVRPHVSPRQALPSCQAANSSELLPNTNRLVSQAGGSRSCYRPWGPSLTPARCLLSGSEVSTPGCGGRDPTPPQSPVFTHREPCPLEESPATPPHSGRTLRASWGPFHLLSARRAP